MSTNVRGVTYDRDQVEVGIVHFGIGNFHRSHQAMYIDRLLRDPSTFPAARSWGICGVGVLPSDRRMRDALRSQDLEYTLVERHPDGAATATRIGSIVDYLFAPEETSAVIERLADPRTRIVSLTITEGGYNISDATGSFDSTNASVLADAAPGATPATVFGLVVAGLRLRLAREIPPFTVVSCDNIEGNGEIARRSITSFAHLIDPELAAWVEQSVSFPSSMVDRITPVTSEADRQWVAEQYGVGDRWPVISEDFVQWVLEDDFTLGRPPLESAGVQLVDDVRPYESMKLRLLNASHQALGHAGLLTGLEYADDAATDPVIKDLVRSFMDDEATPTLSAVPGVDLTTYKQRLLERFANPYIKDTVARLATDASDRIPKFLVPVIQARRGAGLEAPLSALIIALWARRAELWAGGATLPFDDRQSNVIEELVRQQQSDPAGFLRHREWFGDLANDVPFASAFTRSLAQLRADADPRATIRSTSGRTADATA